MQKHAEASSAVSGEAAPPELSTFSVAAPGCHCKRRHRSKAGHLGLSVGQLRAHLRWITASRCPAVVSYTCLRASINVIEASEAPFHCTQGTVAVKTCALQAQIGGPTDDSKALNRSQ